jgi:Domain of unknown function (DUF4386)
MNTQTKSIRIMNAEAGDSSWASLYNVGGIAALGIVALVFIQALIFILYPQPATVLGHIQQFQQSKLLGLVDLDLILLLSEVLTIPVLLALYGALRRCNPAALSTALITGLGGIGLFIAVNPTFAMLYLSDQYAAATTELQRTVFLAAGEALWANYNGTAFGLFFILCGISYIIISAVMLKSGIFNKATAIVGLAMGFMMLVPPLPTLGMLPLALSYLVILPSVAWNILVGIRLLQLGRSAAQQPSA